MKIIIEDVTNDFAVDLIKLAHRHNANNFLINTKEVINGSASIEGVVQMFNSFFTDQRFARVSIISQSMRNSFLSVKYLMPDSQDWKKYLKIMCEYKFESIKGKIGLPFFLSDKVITNYLSGQYESPDKTNLDKLYEEYYKQRGVNVE
jgi:hypothetical protein